MAALLASMQDVAGPRSQWTSDRSDRSERSGREDRSGPSDRSDREDRSGPSDRSDRQASALAPLDHTAVNRIDPQDLRLDEKAFAKGGSGQVFRGTYAGNAIAAKQVFSTMSKEDRVEFDREVRPFISKTAQLRQ